MQNLDIILLKATHLMMLVCLFVTYFSIESFVDDDLLEEADTRRGVHLIQKYLYHHDIIMTSFHYITSETKI